VGCEIKAEAPQRQQALSAEQLMRQLIDAEITDRQTRSLKYQLKGNFSLITGNSELNVINYIQ
jgi:hypothetical protein